MRNPFARLAKRDTARPSLRERAASLKASAARVIRRAPLGDLPDPGSEEARARFRAACTETDRLSRHALHGYPELQRNAMETWTRHSLQRALDSGEIEPAECAGLYRLAAEREHRIDAAVVATSIGTLHILAYADDFTRAAAEMAAGVGADPILAAIAESERLTLARNVAADLPMPDGRLDPLPEQDAAQEAFWAHVDGVLLKTVPTTAEGCAALARYALEFLKRDSFVIDMDDGHNAHVRILDLIARSPLR